MKFTATELAKVLKGTVDGNPHATAISFAKIESGKEGQLCFFANPKYEQYVYTTTASILLVNKDFEPKQAVTPTMIREDNAYAAIAELLKYVSDQKKSYRRHRGLCSSIAPSARIGKKVYVGDFTHIGRGCKVGDYTKIYENVYGLKIGDANIDLEAIIPPLKYQTALSLPKESPVLFMRCSARQQSGAPLYYVECYYSGNNYVFSAHVMRG